MPEQRADDRDAHMLAGFLAGLVGAELALYVVGGALVSSHLGVSAFWSLPFALAAALAVRAALIALSFSLSRRYAASIPAGSRLHAMQKVKLFVDELLAYTALFTLMQPLEPLFVSKPPVARAGGGDPCPVVLIPGIYCNAAVWWSMTRRFRVWGLHSVWPITLRSPLASIDDLAQQLSLHIARICEATGAPRVVLVGHSMGGLVARACLRDLRTRSRIAKVVSLASPHHGSELARWAIGANGRQLRPGNAWLAALNSAEENAAPVPIVSIFTWHDNLVAPQDSPILPHATNVALAGVGHLALLFSEAVAQRVHREIVAAAQM